jgi:hypothetical protein
MKLRRTDEMEDYRWIPAVGGNANMKRRKHWKLIEESCLEQFSRSSDARDSFFGLQGAEEKVTARTSSSCGCYCSNTRTKRRDSGIAADAQREHSVKN